MEVLARSVVVVEEWEEEDKEDLQDLTAQVRKLTVRIFISYIGTRLLLYGTVRRVVRDVVLSKSDLP